MNLILYGREECSEDGSVRFSDRRFIHIRNVLGLKTGDTVKCGELNGRRKIMRIVNITENECVLQPCNDLHDVPPTGLDLILALPRPKCLKRLWPQIASMGIGNVFITNAEKVEPEYWGACALHDDVCVPLIKEGLEQCGDTAMPRVHLVRRLRPFIEDKVPQLYKGAVKYVAHPGKVSPPDDGICSETLEGGKFLLAIGPEGGWNDFELELFENAGFTKLRLGERIMRTDTAVVAGAAVILYGHSARIHPIM